MAFASAAAIVCATSGVAAAQDGGVPGTQGVESSASRLSSGGSSPSSQSGGGSGSGGFALRSENAVPGKVFFRGIRKAAYHFSIGGSRSRDLRIQVVNRATWAVERSWKRDNVAPGSTETIRWAGTLRGGQPARKGNYFFRVRERGGQLADRSRSKKDGDRSFGLYPFKFPVRGRHTYGDGVGAPRSGHIHEGQDVLARCGTKLVAVRGGRVQYRHYQAGGAGNYIVIDGRKTGHDWMYAHLRRPSPLHRGQRVRTGEMIGRVGATGDATGCHLHIEEWSAPGWYEGGHYMRAITKHLKRWDRWS